MPMSIKINSLQLITLSLVILLVITNSCITASSYSKKITCLINLRKNNPFVELEDVKIVRGLIDEKENHIEVIFNSVRGGNKHNIILGTTEIKDGNDGLRFGVTCSEKVVVKFTPNQIKKWEIVDGIYIAPRLCKD